MECCYSFPDIHKIRVFLKFLLFLKPKEKNAYLLYNNFFLKQNNEWNQNNAGLNQAPAQTDNWDQAPAQTDNWDQAPAQTDNWDQVPAQTDNWDQVPAQTDNWDQAPAQTDNWDPAQAQPNIWDQAQTDDWNQDAADQNADLGHGGWDDQNANVDWNTDANQVNQINLF
jgi:hypothetical protein